jgi:aspartyl-tRNA(Asn)/glutamyl-tRNA(Gln) amidotransferase subunit C
MPAAYQARPAPDIDRETVARIARLARLEVSDAECGRLQEELAAIIGYFQSLEKLDTAGVEPAFLPHSLGSPLRADDCRPGLPRTDLLALAARSKDGFLVAPRTVEEGG